MPAYLALDGIWTWFNERSAVYSATYNKTFMAAADHLGTSLGGLWVQQYDHATSQTTGFPVITGSTTSGDDHNNPAIAILTSGKLLAAWTYHPGDNILTRTSTNVGDALVWNSVVTITQDAGATQNEYVKIAQLSTPNKIYLFYLMNDGSSRHLRYHTSTDDGATWSAYSEVTSFANGQQPYFRMSSNGTTRVDFTCTDNHPLDATKNKIYHFYMTDSGGGPSWFKSDDTDVTGNLPLAAATLTTVIDPGAGIPSWVWDIYHNGGSPVICFTVFPAGDGTDHRYRMARWNGSTWTNTTIDIATGQDLTPGYLYAAESYYSGGIAVNPSNINEVMVSRKESGQFEMSTYSTANSGTSWAKSVQVTAASSKPNARPVYVYSGNGSAAGGGSISWIYWGGGTYTTYNNYTGINLYGYPAPTNGLIAKDSFTETAGQVLAGQHLTPEAGHSWTAGGVDAICDGAGYVYKNSTTGVIYNMVGVAMSANYRVKCTLKMYTKVANDNHGVCARMTGGSTFTCYHTRYVVNATDGNSSLVTFRFIAGVTDRTFGTETMTALGTTPITAGTTADVELEVLGTGATVTLNVYYRGSLVVTYTDTDANRIVQVGFPGIRLIHGTSGGASTGMHLGSFLATDSTTASGSGLLLERRRKLVLT